MASFAWWLVSRVLHPKLRATEREVRGLRYSFSTNAEDLILERLCPGQAVTWRLAGIIRLSPATLGFFTGKVGPDGWWSRIPACLKPGFHDDRRIS